MKMIKIKYNDNLYKIQRELLINDSITIKNLLDDSSNILENIIDLSNTILNDDLIKKYINILLLNNVSLNYDEHDILLNYFESKSIAKKRSYINNIIISAKYIHNIISDNLRIIGINNKLEILFVNLIIRLSTDNISILVKINNIDENKIKFEIINMDYVLYLYNNTKFHDDIGLLERLNDINVIKNLNNKRHIRFSRSRISGSYCGIITLNIYDNHIYITYKINSMGDKTDMIASGYIIHESVNRIIFNIDKYKYIKYTNPIINKFKDKNEENIFDLYIFLESTETDDELGMSYFATSVNSYRCTPRFNALLIKHTKLFDNNDNDIDILINNIQLQTIDISD